MRDFRGATAILRRDWAEFKATMRENLRMARAAWCGLSEAPEATQSPLSAKQDASWPTVQMPVGAELDEAHASSTESSPYGEVLEVSTESTEELRRRILEFLETCQEGIRVSDMEQALGVSRMRLGHICRAMLDEGLLTKDGKLYFRVQ